MQGRLTFLEESAIFGSSNHNAKRRETRAMNGKLITKTVLITVAIIAALAYFSYNASYNPDFSAIDFITALANWRFPGPKEGMKRGCRITRLTDFELNFEGKIRKKPGGIHRA